MNFKKIGLIAGGSLASFIAMIAVMYFLFPYINPEKKKEIQQDKPETEQESRFDLSNFSTKAVDSLNIKVQNLQQTVDSLKTLETDYVAQIDSLEGQISLVQEEKEVIKTEVPEKITAKNLEDVSKSLLNLDEEELAPIVNLLEDKQLVGLYNSASNMQRAKLLRSLKPDKAATILKKVM
jgi:preprotein translocase subunit YajC